MGDELIDPKPLLEEKCKPKCSSWWKEYEACAERVRKSNNPEAHCSGQYFDFYHCIDKCAAPEMLKHVK
eukprot:maker-scaffold_7-snap-gene-2.18-mRNA-1 protein AED:0.35 eAED:0.35 QI:159/1/1/1/1/1/3/121/68